MTERAKGRTRIAVPVMVAVPLIVVAWIGWGLWSFDRAMNPSPPDVAALANAPGTRTADRAATALTTRQLAQFRERTPWADQLGTSVADLCETEIFDGAIGGVPHWQPVSCRRTTVLYFAFDGDIHQRLADLDKTIAALGWTASGRGLVAQDRYMHQPSDGADPSESASAAARPTWVSVYFTGRQVGLPRLAVEVDQLPGVPSPVDSWDDFSTDHPGRRPYLSNSMAQAVYFAWQPVNTKQLAATAASHRYLAAFDLDATYYAQPAAPSPTPSPSSPLWSPCYSGTLCP